MRMNMQVSAAKESCLVAPVKKVPREVRDGVSVPVTTQIHTNHMAVGCACTPASVKTQHASTVPFAAHFSL